MNETIPIEEELDEISDKCDALVKNKQILDDKILDRLTHPEKYTPAHIVEVLDGVNE